MRTALATRRHVLRLQIRIDHLQAILLVDIQPTEITGFTQSHDFLTIFFIDGNHPEHWGRLIKSRDSLAENGIPLTANARQQEAKKRGVVSSVLLAWMHRTSHGFAAACGFGIALIAVTGDQIIAANTPGASVDFAVKRFLVQSLAPYPEVRCFTGTAFECNRPSVANYDRG